MYTPAPRRESAALSSKVLAVAVALVVDDLPSIRETAHKCVLAQRDCFWSLAGGADQWNLLTLALCGLIAKVQRRSAPFSNCRLKLAMFAFAYA